MMKKLLGLDRASNEEGVQLWYSTARPLVETVFQTIAGDDSLADITEFVKWLSVRWNWKTRRPAVESMPSTRTSLPPVATTTAIDSPSRATGPLATPSAPTSYPIETPPHAIGDSLPPETSSRASPAEQMMSSAMKSAERISKSAPQSANYPKRPATSGSVRRTTSASALRPSMSKMLPDSHSHGLPPLVTTATDDDSYAPLAADVGSVKLWKMKRTPPQLRAEQWAAKRRDAIERAAAMRSLQLHRPLRPLRHVQQPQPSKRQLLTQPAEGGVMSVSGSPLPARTPSFPILSPRSSEIRASVNRLPESVSAHATRLEGLLVRLSNCPHPPRVETEL